MTFPDPERFVAGLDGVRLALYHLAGPRGAPALVWGHANGFAAGSYAVLLGELARDHDVWAWDQRGHGASPLPSGAVTEQSMTLALLADDAARICAEVRAATGAQPWAGGHSLGALALLHAARREPPWRGACFFEPSAPTAEILAEAAGSVAPRVAATLRRRSRWPDPAQFAARLREHPAYAAIADAVLADHARALLHRCGEAWELNCPPEVEAAVYRLTLSSTVADALRPIARPLCFVASDEGGRHWVAANQAELARRTGATLRRLAGTTHFLPLEKPSDCAAVVRSVTRTVPGTVPLGVS